MKNLKKYLEIGKKFKKANDYANHATIQKQVLDELLDLIPNKDFKSVLELGSGSINNKKFYQKTLGIKDIYINDLIDAKFINLLGNMLEVDFPKVDLCVSSSAIHWLEEDMDELFDKVYNSLNEDGLFVFSIYTKGNVCEVENIINNLCYYSNEELIDKLNKRFKVEYNEVNEKVKEYFQRNTTLKIINQNPDLLLEGTIVGYEMTPQAPTSDDKAGLNRLTMKIQFSLVNRLDETKNFDQEFSFYQDFPQNQTLTQVEKNLIPKLVDQIILDLFNKIAGDW